MGRARRQFPPGSVVHALNRGNERRLLFARPRDYDDFLDDLDDAIRRVPLKLLAYALMPNHWHLLLGLETGLELSQFMHYLTCAHSRRFRLMSATLGLGHVYQGRFRSHVIESEVRYVRTLRYIEANPLRAGLVARAEEWRWTSLADRSRGVGRVVEGPFPLPCLTDWRAIVNFSDAEAVGE